MPFIPRTPESLLPRSDSKNPATTCKGITASGRPCRRALAASSARGDNAGYNGVLAVVAVDYGAHTHARTGIAASADAVDAAAFFCWQHKDQAERLMMESTGQGSSHRPGPRNPTAVIPLKERTSIDTLIERIGVLEIEDNINEADKRPARVKVPRKRVPDDGEAPMGRIARPPTWQGVEGPLMAVPEEILPRNDSAFPIAPSKEQHEERQHRPGHGARRHSRIHNPPTRKQEHRRDARPKGHSSLFSCCFGTPDDDYVEIVRHRKRVSDVTTRPEMAIRTPDQPQRHSESATQRKRDYSSVHEKHQRKPETFQPGWNPPDQSSDRRNPPGPKAVRPLTPATGSSPTATYLSLIPKSLPPHVASSLLAELSKPISPADEPGFIYIFCLKSDTAHNQGTNQNAGADTAAALLTPPTNHRLGQRRASDIIREFATGPPSVESRGLSGPRSTILLKIGRASNVHRRMNEWTRQCGHTPSLVRFYPYVPSASPPSPAPSTPRQPLPARPPVQHSAQSSPSTPSPHARGARPLLNGQTHSSPAGTGVGADSDSAIRKVPFSRRVERLVHLELADRRVRRSCGACGKEHREWFEVEASRAGVAAVDEVVRRWVRWAEGAAHA